MKKTAFLLVLTLVFAGLVFADHEYSEVGSVHDIMEVVQGPSMKFVSDMMKAGGPQNDDDWKHVKARASVLGEASQLMLMGARVKDEPWTTGAMQVITGSKEVAAAADAKDAAALTAAMGALGSGCRTCHKVYKKQK